MNLAQQGLSAYGKSQSSSNRSDDRDDRDDSEQKYSKTGGHEFNSPHHRSGGGESQSYFNEDEVVKKASSQGSGDSSMFSSALAHISSNPSKHHEPIDEDEATEAHRKVYNQGSTEGLSASSMGSAAALQVLKQFTGGGNKSSSKSDLISLAMAEASKLFDSSGGSAQGNKQDAINGAGMTIMKLMVQSKLGGGSSGGMGGLMSLASKFM